MHFLGLIVCLLLMYSVLSLGTLAGSVHGQSTTALAIGFLLLTAFIAGRVSRRMQLPRITGYLLLGITIGPRVINLITGNMIEDLLFINGLAISLIALSAGGELKLEWLRGKLKQILIIAIVGAVIVFSTMFGIVYFLRDWFALAEESSSTQQLILAVIFGVFAVANSPMVVIALITETDNRGSFAQIVLGVTIIRDVLVIVLFSLVLAVADTVLGGRSMSLGDFIGMISLEIGGSAVIGILLGWGLTLCARFFWKEMPFVVLIFCFFMAHLSTALHMDALLMGLAAGFFVENWSKKGGDELIAGIERCSLPLYCLFFGLAGVSLDIRALAQLWPVALTFALVRCLGLWIGTALGAHLSGCERAVRNMGWLGFIANAGVLLAMASIVTRTFPQWGKTIETLVIAIIGINLIIGPVGLRFALLQTKEAPASNQAQS